MLQGHCTNNDVTCLQSQQQLKLAPSCSVVVERCLEQQRFYLSPERNAQIRSSDRGRKSVPGPRSGHWKWRMLWNLHNSKVFFDSVPNTTTALHQDDKSSGDTAQPEWNISYVSFYLLVMHRDNISLSSVVDNISFWQCSFPSHFLHRSLQTLRHWLLLLFFRRLWTESADLFSVYTKNKIHDAISKSIEMPSLFVSWTTSTLACAYELIPWA